MERTGDRLTVTRPDGTVLATEQRDHESTRTAYHRATCLACALECCLDHGTEPDRSEPTATPRALPAWPAEVLAWVRRYTGAADRGDMLAALELQATWPAGLCQCSCEGGVVGGEDDCDKCGGIGLYYQPESEAA
mgnify:CR=1 FL=1